jgi:hypothetical protein
MQTARSQRAGAVLMDLPKSAAGIYFFKITDGIVAEHGRLIIIR